MLVKKSILGSTGRGRVRRGGGARPRSRLVFKKVFHEVDRGVNVSHRGRDELLGKFVRDLVAIKGFFGLAYVLV